MANNPDTLPTLDDLTGKCPRCGRISNFDMAYHHILRTVNRLAPAGPSGIPDIKKTTVEQLTVVRCMGCTGQSVVIEAEVTRGDGVQGVLWWPTEHLADLTQAAGVPQEIVAAYSEGIRCLAVQAPNAAAAMFRTTIAQIIQDKGSTAAKAKSRLVDAINQMDQDGTMWPDFGDWAHHVRQTGNAGAHGEKFDPVTIEQASELQVFVREIINFLYVQPARRAAAKAVAKKGSSPTPAVATPPTGGAGGGQA